MKSGNYGAGSRPHHARRPPTRSERNMRIGIVSPVLIQHPATRADWEVDAGIDDVARIAEAADRLGYHHVTCSEHVASRSTSPPGAAGPLLGPARHLRLPRRPHQPDPVRDLRARARLPPPARRSPSATAPSTDLRRPGDPRRRRRLAAARSSTCSARRSTTAARGPTTRCARCGPRFGSRSPSTTASTTTTRTSSSIRARCSSTVPLWIGGRTPRSLRRAVELGRRLGAVRAARSTTWPGCSRRPRCPRTWRSC